MAEAPADSAGSRRRSRAHAQQPVGFMAVRLVAWAMVCATCLFAGAAVGTWHAQRGAAGDAPPAAQAPPEDAVQAELTAHGWATTISGTLDAATVTSLKAFQTANGLAADSVVGRDTWRDLIN